MMIPDAGQGDFVTLEYAGRGFVTGRLRRTWPNGDLIIQEGRYRPRFFRHDQIVNLTVRESVGGGRSVPPHGSGP